MKQSPNLVSGDQSLPSNRERRFVDLGSHQMTLHRAPADKNPWAEENVTTSTDYHLTVSIARSEFSRRDASLLLDVLNYQIAYFGCNFVQYLVLMDLYLRVLGSNRNASEVADGNIRLTLTVSELFLKLFKSHNEEGFILAGEYLRVPDNWVEKLSKIGGLMTKRTYGSRHRFWRPEQLLLIKTVPVDIQFLTRDTSSSPYDSYCKGYGESHPSSHTVRTRPTFELDGDVTPPDELKDHKIFRICTEKRHVIANSIEIWQTILNNPES